MNGLEHDRHTIAALFDIKPAAADDIIVGLLRSPGIPGVKDFLHGRTRKIRFDSKAEVPFQGKGAPNVPPLAAVLAACIGASLSKVFRGSPYDQGLRDARDFLLQASRSKSITDVERKFLFVERGGEWALQDRGSDLRTLVAAILDSDYVKFKYHHNDGRTETLRVAPLSLVIFGHQLYMICARPEGDFYPYRLARMIRLEVIDQPSFSYPTKDEYDPERLFRDTFGIFIAGKRPVSDVEVRLKGAWANFAHTHRWHPSQENRATENGVLVKLEHIRVCPEVESWILGFGADGEVVGPDWLRSKIADTAQRMAATYAGKQGASKKKITASATTRRRKGPTKRASRHGST